MDKFTKGLLKSVGIYCIFAIVILILFQTVLMLSIVPTESMEGTIEKWDFLLSTRYDVGEDDLDRYDILIFKPLDEPDQTYVKRLIGLPGETIEVSNGKVYADGVLLEDSFIQAPMNGNGDGVFTVPDGCYFFLGDNRNNSMDSRFWEKKFVPLNNIQAKVKFIS